MRSTPSTRDIQTVGSRKLPALLALCLAMLPFGAVADDAKPLERIAFGSCAKQNKPQPIWEAVLATRPDLFLMIGDNIYGDTTDMDVLRAKYRKLGDVPGFRKLRESTRLLAVWDDHDYGANDAGADYEKRKESQQVFNDFFRVPKNSPRRKRPGIYDAHVFGPAGKRVQVILLDTRYFRSPLKKWPEGDRKTMGPYAPNRDPGATMLGEAQWKWLAEQLEVPAELRIVASSIQVVPAEHGWEMWENFPAERERLFKLIAKQKANGVVFVSGDRHLAEISRLPGEKGPVAYPLYDITSSSLNQPSGGGNEGEPNRYRLSPHYTPVNFGTILIDWDADDPPLRLQIRDLKGRVVREERLKLSRLSPGSPSPGS